MPRKALSKTKKAQLECQERDRLMARAVVQYHAEQSCIGPGRKMGLRQVCREVEKEFFKETGRTITLNHNTLRNLANGGRSLTEFTEGKCWLLKEEVEEVIAYVKETAAWGYGLSHRRLKEYVDEICQCSSG
ncbi:hypothetical protein C8J56DRAFT_896196 [Mycena floridula]|nr:hypothetical protein C8J56DRAFT_896196 [Mycena floridula]